jgi:ATP-dependent DNA ligase
MDGDVSRAPLWPYNGYIDDDGTAFFEQACRVGLEGIVSKRLSAPLPVGAEPALARGEERG